MGTVEVGETTVRGSDELPAPEEEAAGEERYETPDRKHVDALLDISEEELLKELELQENHCSSSWDETIRGWARASPLSCILVTQNCKKPKQKESADPPFPNAEGSATNNTPDQLNQQAGSRCHTVSTGPLQSQASRWSVIGVVQRNHTDDLREAPVKTRSTKVQRPNHTINTVVPIRHFKFLPPIASPHLRCPIPNSGAKGPEGKGAEDAGLIFDKKSRTRGRMGAPNPELPVGVCQDNPRLFSAISISAQNRYLMAGASKCNTAHCGRLSGKNDLHFGMATRMNPSKAACAVNL